MQISSALLICMAIGAILEDMTTDRAKKGLRKLISLAPETARIVRDANVKEVPIALTVPGDVGVAMGAMGSDIAVEAADVALMADDISRLPYLKWLSNTCVRTIKGAITLSMYINFVAVSLSVMGVLNPVTGALVHNCGSCFVVLVEQVQKLP